MKTPTPQVLARRLREVGPVRRAAEAELASLPDGLMAAMVLSAWADFPARRRRELTLVAVIAVSFWLTTFVVEWNRAASEQFPLPPILRASFGPLLGSLWTIAIVAATRRYCYLPRYLRPLLLCLDDVRLVPLWLASVRAQPGHDERTALLEKLAKWLPRWHETETPLPETARKDLAREIARCGKRGKLSDAEAAFLTAALVALDADPARGIPPDGTLRGSVVDLTRTPGRVGEAAADALQRLGPPL